MFLWTSVKTHHFLNLTWIQHICHSLCRFFKPRWIFNAKMIDFWDGQHLLISAYCILTHWRPRIIHRLCPPDLDKGLHYLAPLGGVIALQRCIYSFIVEEDRIWSGTELWCIIVVAIGLAVAQILCFQLCCFIFFFPIFLWYIEEQLYTL